VKEEILDADQALARVDKNLVFEFFWAFSSLDCALKRSGYVRGDSTYAEADWDAFAEKLSGRFAEIHDGSFHAALSPL
jgi:hypothetical protein